ncbi:MAG: hypothetical protein V3U93_04290 [Alphaproteobacteria bacterium]
MSEQKDSVIGSGTVLRGNFAPRGSNDPRLSASGATKSEALRRTEEFEKAARERIGGSIAFVTRLKDGDALFWNGEDD